MTLGGLRARIDRLAGTADADRHEARAAVNLLLSALESGAVRAAEPTPKGWIVNAWVKRGLLLAFRCGVNESLAVPLEVWDPATKRKTWIIRLSVGLESVADLEADLLAAL